MELALRKYNSKSKSNIENNKHYVLSKISQNPWRSHRNPSAKALHWLASTRLRLIQFENVNESVAQGPS